MENPIYVKIEDDRSLGERAKNVLSNAGEQYVEALEFVTDKTVDLAHQLVNKVTGDAPVTNEEITEAALKHQQLRELAEMDRFRAEGAESQRLQLQADAQRMQQQQQLNRQHAEIMRDAKQKQAEEVVRLENKQSAQQAQKCHEAMKKSGACHPHDITVTRITEIH